MAEHSEESVPLLGTGGAGEAAQEPAASTTGFDNVNFSAGAPGYGGVEGGGRTLEEEEEEQASQRHPSGMTVNCRVCDAVIELEGRATQHVVKCSQCMEATPIRPAPPGKKYVRCPCNCLLICKAASTRIACPRQNCRRVITLGQTSTGTAMQAPTGTCRVACAHCEEVFMFNTLTNTLATCPHCRKRSSVGAAFRRTRLLGYSAAAFLLLLFSVILAVVGAGGHLGFWWLALIALFALTLYTIYKAGDFFFCAVSTIVSPV